MLDQLGRELIAGWKDDLSIRCLLELRASLTGSPVSMVELFQSTGCEGRELAGSGAPARAEELKHVRQATAISGGQCASPYVIGSWPNGGREGHRMNGAEMFLLGLWG